MDPTTETLAQWIYVRTAELLTELAPVERARVHSILVHETEVNSAEFIAD